MSSPKDDLSPPSLSVISARKNPDGSASVKIRVSTANSESIIEIDPKLFPDLDVQFVHQTGKRLAELADGLQAGDIVELRHSVVPESGRNIDQASPPSSFLLSALLPLELSEELIGLMEMLYRDKWSKRHNTFIAKLIWYFQIARLVVWRSGWPIGALLLGAWKFIKIKLG